MKNKIITILLILLIIFSILNYKYSIEIDRLNSTESDFDKFCEEKNIAIENLLKRNKELEESLIKLKEKMQKEYNCAIEGFIKKQIPTSVVDGTIAQELGWILQEIDKILGGLTNE